MTAERRRVGVGAALLFVACGPAPSRTPERPVADKARIYGDPALVPTRAGEAARAEVAAAGELERLLHEAGFADLRVTLERPRSGDAAPPRAAIVATRPPDLIEAELAVRRLASVSFGPEVELEILLRDPKDAGPRRPGTDPLLWLALLGFGASAGIAIDRWRSRPASGARPPVKPTR